MQRNTLLFIVIPALFLLLACNAGPEPIRYGKDECHHCKMTLTDKRFGAELITAKGKVFKFDDLNCLVGFIKEGTVAPEDIAQTVSTDFNKPGAFVDLQKGFFLKNEMIKSPMRADIACFATQSELDLTKTKLGGGEQLAWADLQNQH